MRQLLTTFLLILAFLAATLGANCEGGFPEGGISGPPTSTGGPQQSVTVSFQPGVPVGSLDASVVPGGIVTWVNNDTIIHSVVSKDGLWSSGPISPGGNFPFTFSTAGSFPYFCGIHGPVLESGTITVVTPAGATPTPAISGFPTPTPVATFVPIN